MTDESARGGKNQRDKFCSAGAAEPPLAHSCLLQIYTIGPDLRGEYSFVGQPVVCTKCTNLREGLAMRRDAHYRQQ